MARRPSWQGHITRYQSVESTTIVRCNLYNTVEAMVETPSCSPTTNTITLLQGCPSTYVISMIPACHDLFCCSSILKQCLQGSAAMDDTLPIQTCCTSATCLSQCVCCSSHYVVVLQGLPICHGQRLAVRLQPTASFTRLS